VEVKRVRKELGEETERIGNGRGIIEGVWREERRGQEGKGGRCVERDQ